MRKFINKLVRDERGVSALEYAILAGLIVAAVVGGIQYFSDEVDEGFRTLGDKVTTAIEGS